MTSFAPLLRFVVCVARKIVVPPVGPALRLDHRHHETLARAPDELIHHDDGVRAVRVHDDERTVIPPKARADATGVLPFKLQGLFRALPVFRRPHLLFPIDDGAREREERDAVRAI
jgi:hypothetical protein